MRSLFAFFMVVLLGASSFGCGGETKHAVSAAHTSSVSFMGDGDADNPGDIDGDDSPDKDPDEDSKTPESYNYHDKDDSRVLDYGHAADGAEERAVTSVVERYYAAAAAGDAPTACSLLLSRLAKSVPEYYAQGAGPPYLRGGKTCQAVLTMLFKHLHAQLTGAIRVTGVRVSGNQAYALLGSTTKPASDITLEREGGSWRMEVLLGSVLP